MFWGRIWKSYLLQNGVIIIRNNQSYKTNKYREISSNIELPSALLSPSSKNEKKKHSEKFLIFFSKGSFSYILENGTF